MCKENVPTKTIRGKTFESQKLNYFGKKGGKNNVIRI
jgi:hypothetical protein